MKYAKFTLKCILVTLPAILLIIYTLLFPMCYMDEEYASWRFSKKVAYGTECVGENFDTLILGDSGAMSSYIPEILSPEGKCVNLAVGGATAVEMYYFLRNYLANHEAPKHVVIMFAPFHYSHIDNYATRTMYFKTLSIKEAKEVYTIAKNIGADSVYQKDVFWDEFACRMGLPTKYLPAITASRFVKRYGDNNRRYAELVANNGYGPFGELDGCDGLSYECSYDGVEVTTDMGLILQYFKMMIEMCDKEGIDVCILQEALNEASYEAISPNYIAEYESHMQIFKNTYPNALIETKLRCYPNDYFGDVSHLNRRGAEIFSNEIKNQYPDLFE